MKTISVIVADDSEFMRESYQAILETAERLEVLGMAADGQEAVFLTDILKPQVAILDIRMPKMDGITAAHQIVANHPNTGIVIISSYDDTSYINELLKTRPAGKAYLLKASLDDVQELIRTVEAVAAGWTVLDPVVVEKLISSQAVKPKSSLAPLSDQERSVLSMLVQGHTSTSISTALGGDASSVDDQVSGIYDKLSVPESSAHDRRVEAVLTFLDPVVVEKLISSQAVKPKSSLAPLSDQERSVLSMLVQGHTSTSISTALGGDASSVDDQVSGIYDKLSVPESSAHDRRVEAVLTFLDIARSPQGR